MKTSPRLVRLASAAALLVAAALAASPAGAISRVREPAVAGSFYPGDAIALRKAVAFFLESARPAGDAAPLALVVPHAGYVYAGQIIADGWRQVAGRDYDVIVIVGPNHRAAGVTGVSIDTAPSYRTPLGVVDEAQNLAARLRAADRRFGYQAAAFAQEHSVEVQLPFAQSVLPGVPVVAAIVGGDGADLWRDFGIALAHALKGRRPLLVASSDLSHYPAYDDAVACDRAFLSAVATVDPDRVLAASRAQLAMGRPQLVTCACGEGPIIAVLTAARALGATRATVVSYANSGDTALGDVERCVGYGAVAITAGDEPSDVAALAPRPAADGVLMLTDTERGALLTFARRTLDQYLSTGTAPLARDLPPLLFQKRGVFVTLLEGGELRGCIGHLAPDAPLARQVGAMTLQAALNDPRFPPVAADDVAKLRLEISVLTPMQRVRGPADVVPGRDGVLLSKHGKSAVFLPQVAKQQGWDRIQMLTALAHKAGLPGDAWRTGAEFQTFQADYFAESAPPR